MAEVIIMPKLGFNMDEGMLVKWNIDVGQPVKKGETLFEIETDKTVMPVEATTDGILLKTLLPEGEYADVFTPIAVVGSEGEDADAALAAAANTGEALPAKAEAAPETAAPVEAPQSAAPSLGDIKLTPKARKYVSDAAIDPACLQSIKGTGFEGGITAKDIKASPLARKIAAAGNIDLSSVEGHGIGGKIMKTDLQAAKPCASCGDEPKRVLSKAPYKGVRKIIGDRLSQSKFTAPHLYFTDSIDMSEFLSMRQKLNAGREQKLAVADFLIKTAAKSLQKYPELNVSLINDEIVLWRDINIGMAVAGENGLIVPVVKHVQELSITDISEQSRALVERAKKSSLTQAEFSHGTFTISNLGMFGIENFTAIINPPEAAILSISSVRKKPVAVSAAEGDSIVIRPVMNVQLSVDHRLIDGLMAAKFVAEFKRLIENPMEILL